MKNLIAISLLLSAGVCAWGGEPKAEPAAPQTILFLGDSITAAGGYVRLIEAELAKQEPSGSWKVVNRGRSSETVSDLSEAYHPGRRPCLFLRLDEELVKAKPDWVVACYGMNDGIYHPFHEKRFAAYQAGIKRLIEKVHAAGSHMILLTPPPYAQPGPAFPEEADAATWERLLAEANAAAEAEAQKDPNKFGYRSAYAYYDNVLARYAQWLLTLNGKDDVWVVDVRTPILAQLKSAYGKDPIHPNQEGHAIMAEAFLKQWPAILSEARPRTR